jgi:hypothetical protein
MSIYAFYKINKKLSNLGVSQICYILSRELTVARSSYGLMTLGIQC